MNFMREDLGENIEIWGVSSENNFGLNSDSFEKNSFPKIGFVSYNKENKTANIIVEKKEYEVLWNKDFDDKDNIGEPEIKISEKMDRIFLIIPDKNSENGNKLLGFINGKIRVIDEIYKEGDLLVSEKRELYNVKFNEHEKIIKITLDGIERTLDGIGK